MRPEVFDRRSHKRLTLLIENAETTRQYSKINPVHLSSAIIPNCKYPEDIAFAYHYQECTNPPIKDKLRYVRLIAGLSQKELADILGIDRVTLTRLENGAVSEENMKTDLLVQIATVCGFEKTYCCNDYHAFIANDAGKQIRIFRREKKLTQLQLAQILNVAHTTVKRWERNENKPSIDKVKEMFPHLIGA